MKNSIKTLLVSALLATGATFLSTSDVLAQNRVRTGIKGGLNASSLFYDSQGVSNKNERIGFHAGVFTQIPVGEFFAVQPELLYMNKGASADYNVVGFTGENTFN